jgi:hypothetical protein
MVPNVSEGRWEPLTQQCISAQRLESPITPLPKSEQLQNHLQLLYFWEKRSCNVVTQVMHISTTTTMWTLQYCPMFIRPFNNQTVLLLNTQNHVTLSHTHTHTHTHTEYITERNTQAHFFHMQVCNGQLRKHKHYIWLLLSSTTATHIHSFISTENTILVLCSAYLPASFWYSTYIPIR